MKYFIGVDGGGTSTSFVLFDNVGTVLDHIKLPTVHVFQTETDEAISIIKKGIKFFDLNQEDIDMICFGMAGYGENTMMRREIESRIKLACDQLPYYIFNDAEIALSAAHNNQDGLIVIAGTGSMSLSKIGNEKHRVGGWGYQLGDEGSGYWIGQQLLNQFTHQIDGRGHYTKLSSAIIDHFGLTDPYELITHINNTKKLRQKISSLAPIAFELSEMNDPIAKKILIDAGINLAKLANAQIAYFNSSEVYTSLIGGLWYDQSILKDSFMKEIDKRIIIRPSLKKLEWGAVLLGKEREDECQTKDRTSL